MASWEDIINNRLTMGCTQDGLLTPIMPGGEKRRKSKDWGQDHQKVGRGGLNLPDFYAGSLLGKKISRETQ